MKIIKREIVKHGQGNIFELQKGDCVKVETIDGGQVACLDFLGFSQAKTRDYNMSIRLKDGDFLCDISDKPVLKVVENHTRATHDLLWPGCRRWVYKTYLHVDKKGCRDIIGKLINVPESEVPDTLNLFMNTLIGLDGKLSIGPCEAKPGDYIVLESLRDVIVAVTSCVDDATPCNPNPSDIRVTVFRI